MATVGIGWTIGGVVFAIAAGAAAAFAPWWAIGLGVLVAAVGMLIGLRRSLPALTRMERHPLALELVALPLVVSIRHSTILTLVLLGLLLLISLARRQRVDDAPINYVPVLLLLLAAGLIFRNGPYTIAALFVLVVLVLAAASVSVSRTTAYASLTAGLSLYLVANIAGWIVGIQSVSASVRVGGYESSGGFFGARVFFPFARSINEPSFIAAALILAVVAMLSVRTAPRWYHWVGVAAGLFVIAASNSRTPLLMLIPAALFILIAPRITRRGAPFVAGGVMLLPFLLPALRPSVNWVAEKIAGNDYLARGQSVHDIGGLGTRDIIWEQSIGFWDRQVDSLLHQVAGFGYNGHAVSGASDYYATGIGDFLSRRSALTMHNSFLQTLFDGGLIGAFCVLGVTVFLVWRYAQRPELLPVFAIALMLGLSAGTEVSLAPGLSQTPVFLLLFLAVFVPRKHRQEQDGQPAASSRPPRQGVKTA
ncbi:O-antigen ligase [Gordonia sp. SCSIO 19800]|uniref:O-antigen ligase family protein n=1 Tax=Gordonia sp. SCSIO 19800 TaxID=2826926 RepID=UPI001B831739|nr:O-antigen ligase family protein [Gordonia sp. SCSIO 19800]MBR7191740.1 O-antigen ligase family protein [Gordonia sp. SCSIO 19800]